MRCPTCGRRAASNASRCIACGDSLQTIVAIEDRPRLMLSTEMSAPLPTRPTLSLPAVRQANALARLDGMPAQRPASTPVRRQRPRNEVRGRVILMEGPLAEPIGFDVTLLLCQILWLGLLSLIPLLVVHAVLAKWIAAPNLLLFLAIAMVLGLISPSRLLQAVSLVFRMGHWGRRGGDTIPIRYLRVRDTETDHESIVRLPGHLSAANVSVDDLVTFRGHRRRGLLYATSGRNLRTGSSIRVWSSRSVFLLIVTLTIYFVVGAAVLVVTNRLPLEWMQ